MEQKSLWGDPDKLDEILKSNGEKEPPSEEEMKCAEDMAQKLLNQVKEQTKKKGIPDFYDAFREEMGRICSLDYSGTADAEANHAAEASEKEERQGFEERSSELTEAMKNAEKKSEKLQQKPILKTEIILDRSGVMRNFVRDSNACFYSMSDIRFFPINLNPFKIPSYVEPQKWIDMVVSLVAQSYSIPDEEEGILTETVYELYQDQGIFDRSETDKFGGDDSEEWLEEVSKRSGNVTFHRIYKKVEMEMMERRRDDILERNTYSDLLRRLSRFSRSYSIEYRLFSAEKDFSDPNSVRLGYGLDEILEDGRITVFETKGMEKRMRKFAEKFVRDGTELMEDSSEKKVFEIHILK